MRIWIYAVAADLARDDAKGIVVGPETARVCREVARVLKKHPGAKIVAAAGKAPNFDHVAMAEGPMHDYFLELGVDESSLVMLRAEDFNTNGEARTFANHVYWAWFNDKSEEDWLILVARWWHMPRAWLLFRACFDSVRWRWTHKSRVLVGSIDWRMIGEPLAFWKNRKNLFRVKKKL